MLKYSGLADEVNIKEKNLVIKSVRLLTSQMFKDLGDEDGKYLFNNFHNVIVRVEAEIDGKTDYFVGNNVSQLGGINYTIKRCYYRNNMGFTRRRILINM